MEARTSAPRPVKTGWLTGPRLTVAGVLLLAVFPLVIRDSYTVHIFVLALMHAALAVSWNVLCGYTGIFSMGHQAFFGLGAYVSALLAMKAGVSPWLGLLIAGVSAAAVSLLIAVPTLRLRAAPYVAIATLGFAEVCRIVAQNLVDLTRGELGLNGIPALPDITLGPLEINFIGRTPFYYVMLVIFLAITFAAYKMIRSPFGLAVKAIRESQDAAESLGVNLTLFKILAFASTAGMAGVVGAFYAHYIQVLTPSSVLSLPLMIEVVAMTLVGGLGTLVGPILGSIALTVGLEYLRFLGDYRMLIYGLSLVPLIMFIPEGLVKRLLPRRFTV